MLLIDKWLKYFFFAHGCLPPKSSSERHGYVMICPKLPRKPLGFPMEPGCVAFNNESCTRWHLIIRGRSIGVITKIDIMDQGTDAVKMSLASSAVGRGLEICRSALSLVSVPT